MTPIEIALLAFVASLGMSTGLLFLAFLTVGSVKRLRDDPLLWAETPLAMKVTTLVVAVPGVIADVYFNWTRGAWIFGEAPWKHRTLMFTHRVQWHLDNSKGRKREIALRWARLGNAIDPGHFKRL